jgi:hypothetical protein
VFLSQFFPKCVNLITRLIIRWKALTITITSIYVYLFIRVMYQVGNDTQTLDSMVVQALSDIVGMKWSLEVCSTPLSPKQFHSLSLSSTLEAYGHFTSRS